MAETAEAPGADWAEARVNRHTGGQGKGPTGAGW